MKKRITILSLLVTLCSCGGEAIERAGDTGIGFTARTGNSTRGTVTDDAGSLVGADKGFDTWTYSHTGAWASASDAAILVDNTGGEGYAHVTSADGIDWDYGTTVVWPGTKLVTSFAVAPHGRGTKFEVTPPSTAGATPKILYNVPASGADQTDLMIARKQADLTYMSYSATIPEIFSHALSRVAIVAARSTEDFPASEVVITSVKFNNLYRSGTAYLDTPVEWTPGDPGTYAFELSAGLSLTGTAQNILSATVGTLFLMPQTLFGRTGGDADVELEIGYTVDGSPMPVWRSSIPTPAVWSPGQSYLYTLTVFDEKVAIVCGELQVHTPGDPWGNY